MQKKVNPSYEKLPPRDVDAELAMLGSMMVDAEAVERVLYQAGITEDMLYNTNNQTVFRTIRSLHDEGTAIDLVTVSGKLQRKNELTQVGGHSLLATMIESVATSMNVLHYAKKVKETWVLRQIRQAAENMIQFINADELTPEEAIEKIRVHSSLIDTLAHKQIGRMLWEVESELLDMMKAEREGRLPTGIKTGIPQLDMALVGLKPCELSLIAARPGEGKTALALQIARNAAKEGHPVLFLELEMQDVELARRMLGMETGTDSSLMNLPNRLIETEFEALDMKVNEHMQMPITLVDSATSLGEMRHAIHCFIREAKANYQKAPLVVVDYLQKVSVSERITTDPVKRVGFVSGALKEIAQKQRVPILALSQLNRHNKGEAKKLPELHDLRWAGELEQDAHAVIMLSEDPQVDYTGCPAESYPWLILLRKNRNGATAEVQVLWNKPIYSFTEF